MIPVYITESALGDIGRLWDELAGLNVDAASRIAAEVVEAALSLREFPERHPVEDRVPGGRCRRFTVHSVSIFYVVTDAQVEVLRVVSAAADMSTLDLRPS
jgi:plasmid stabilization system protein ParE